MSEAPTVAQTALITGSTSGIGRATAKLLARAGATVIITGRDGDRAEVVRREVESAGGRGIIALADLANRDDVQRLAEQAATATDGRIDILVNNADEPFGALTAETSTTDFDRVMATNVRAPFHLVTKVTPLMMRNGGGVIVNVSGVAARLGVPGLPVYSAAKAALSSLTRTWAAEYGPAGIRVNAVEVGPVGTPRAEPMLDLLRAYMASAPARRIGVADEVAAVIAFLASPAASYIHGAVLPVDGGQSITLAKS